MKRKEITERIMEQVQHSGVDYSETLASLEAIRRRERGEEFSFSQHVKGMIYSLLSNQRPWHSVVPRLEELDTLFFDYDVDKILQRDGSYFEQGVRKLKCGNIAIKKQMDSLPENIATLRRIEKKYGSLDVFVTSDTPLGVATLLAENPTYKLKMVGVALALEYLRNVGIDEIKPDVHLRRMLGGERLCLAGERSPASEEDTIKAVASMAEVSGYRPAEINSYLWLFCATGYVEICTATPKCNRCSVADYCAYPQGENEEKS